MRFEEALSVALAELGSANTEALQQVRLYIPNACMEYICFPQGREGLFKVQLQYVCTCVETVLTQRSWTPTLSDLIRTDWRYHLSHRRVILVNEVLRMIPVTREEKSMNFYEAFREGLQTLKNNGVGHALQKLRFYRVRSKQKEGDDRQPYICIAAEDERTYMVILEGLGTSLERIVDYKTWFPYGTDLVMDDWNYAVSDKRVFWDGVEGVLKLIPDEVIVRERTELRATTTVISELPDLLRTAAQVLEAHLRTGADVIETINPKD